ncbi:hypothetical protein EON82_06790 [bacterium]|nr:MAG: hypothetical protein EON82_06790 [bacterium]
MAYAQVWRSLMRPEQERRMVARNVHAPAAVRVAGPVADHPAFYRTFGLPVPEGLPRVW